MNAKTTTEQIAARLDQLVAGEERVWKVLMDACTRGRCAADVLSGGEEMLRTSLTAYHARAAQAALAKDGLDGLATHLDKEATRLFDGVYAQRRANLLLRRRGELEHDTVRDLVREFRAMVYLAQARNAPAGSCPGCRLSYEGEPCPLHRAAPDLATGCREALAFFEVNDDEEALRVAGLLRGALARAEGGAK